MNFIQRLLSRGIAKFIPAALICKYPRLLLITDQDYYVYCLFSFFQKVVFADGEISPDEVKRMANYLYSDLHLSKAQRTLANEIFWNEKKRPTSIDQLISLFMRRFAQLPGVHLHLVDMLLGLALADGELHEKEDTFIWRIASKLSIQRARYDSLREANRKESERKSTQGSTQAKTQRERENSNSRNQQQKHGEQERFEKADSRHKHAYQTLGILGDESWDSIKSTFHKLIKENHPDLLLSKGLPSESLHRANRRCQELTEAFDFLREQRNVR